MLKYMQYENKETKEKANAIDAISLVESMSDMETLNGVTKEKILDNWYQLKREISEAALAQPTDEKK